MDVLLILIALWTIFSGLHSIPSFHWPTSLEDFQIAFAAPLLIDAYLAPVAALLLLRLRPSGRIFLASLYTLRITLVGWLFFLIGWERVYSAMGSHALRDTLFVAVLISPAARRICSAHASHPASQRNISIENFNPLTAAADSTLALQIPAVSNEADSEAVDTSPVKSWITERREALRSFLRTRRAIFSGLPLWDCSRGQIRRSGLLDPVAYQLRQSSTCALIGVATGWLLIVSVPSAADSHDRAVQGRLYERFYTRAYRMVIDGTLDKDEVGLMADRMMQEAEKSGLQRAIKRANDLGGTMIAACPPFLCWAFGLLLTRASLHFDDNVVWRRRRTMAAYLYFDATVGVIPQAIAVVAATVVTGVLGEVTLSKLMDGARLKSSPVLTVAVLAFIGVALWQACIVMVIIPRRLFKISGYSTETRRHWVRWGRYLVMANVGPALVVAIVKAGISLVAGLWSFLLLSMNR